MRPVVAVTYRGAGEATDGILGYSRRLREAIEETGRLGACLIEGDAAGWRVDGGAPVGDLPTALRASDGVLLQYNPFSYGPRGFAPWLLRDLRRLKRQGIPIALMVHEAYLRPVALPHWILTAWQRLQLRMILGVVDVAFASTEAVVKQVGRLGGDLRIHHLPVGSNLPDRRFERSAMRSQLDLTDDDLVLVAFRTGHPSQLGTVVSRATQAVAGRSAVLLNLGAGAPPVTDVPSGMRVLTPGRLEEAELASWLAAGDVFVATFSDGASTRRTTLMAAFQHELAVVATSGPNTDSLLQEASDALSLVDADAPGQVEQAVSALAGDHQKRHAVGKAGRRLFDEQFDWPVLAEQVADALSTAWPSLASPVRPAEPGG